MIRTLRVAGALLPVVADVRRNAAALARAIDHAAAEGAELLVTPEGALSGYTYAFDSAEVDAAIDEVRRYARTQRVGLVLGVCFQDRATGARYDAQRFYGRDGEDLGFHAKILLSRPLGRPDDAGDSLFAAKPLSPLCFGDLRVGGLVCNDLWANPEWTPMDDPHLSQRLAAMGARVIFHSVNSGFGEGEDLALNRAYHDANLRLRARSGRLWIVTVDAVDPEGLRSNQAPSGIVDPRGRWVVEASGRGEQYFVHTLTIEE